MKFNLTLIGFGVIGVESLHALVTKIKEKQNYKIAVIEKSINNIPGGVAYSKANSKFGFFNNPLRLSHPLFKSWINNKKNKDKIISFIKKNQNYHLSEWLKNNFNNLKKKKITGEMYFPRLIYSFYLEDKIIKILVLLKKKKIKILYFNGELNKIDFKNKNLILKSKSNFKFFKIIKKKNLIKILKTNKKTQLIESQKIIIGTGLLPPKKINYKDDNYIWDFYSEGGTNNLLKKIKLIYKKKKQVILTFIGNKAGLLETTLQLKRLVEDKKYNIKINVVSKKSATLNKAKFSKNYKNFKLSVLKKHRINKIKNAKEILILLKKEFKLAPLKKFNKYDVWSTILKKNILSKSLSRLNFKEQKKYNISIFPLIRNMTRFTYPETIDAKEYLEKNKQIKTFLGRAVEIKKYKKNIFVKTNNKNYIKSDIVINVSGPVNLDDISKETNFIKSIKNNTNKIDKRGFITNKSFMLTDQIFMPGILAYNFNPYRQTIIKAITNNSRKAANVLLSNLAKN